MIFLSHEYAVVKANPVLEKAPHLKCVWEMEVQLCAFENPVHFTV